MMSLSSMRGLRTSDPQSPTLSFYKVSCPGTYVSSLISSILTSQIFRKQFWGALSELYHTTLWEMLYLKMSWFVSLLYKQEFFYYFMWMSPWRIGSMQVSHTEGPWFQSRSSSFLNFFFFRNIFFSTFHIKISVQNVFYMNLKEKTRDLCRRKILQKKKNELDRDWNQGPSACETCMLPLRHGDIHIK